MVFCPIKRAAAAAKSKTVIDIRPSRVTDCIRARMLTASKAKIAATAIYREFRPDDANERGKADLSQALSTGGISESLY